MKMVPYGQTRATGPIQPAIQSGDAIKETITDECTGKTEPDIVDVDRTSLDEREEPHLNDLQELRRNTPEQSENEHAAEGAISR